MLGLPLLALAGLSAAATQPWVGHVPHKLQKRDALAPFPSGNAVYIGGWVNGQQGYSDTPAAMNARLNLSLPLYQFGQKIPLVEFNYVEGVAWDAFTFLIDYTNTNANYFITMYGDDGLAAITDGDLVALGYQLRAYADAGREVYLRWLPEMQGGWMSYGLQPVQYVALWRKMYAVIKELSPTTQIIWAPNLGIGYPYGATLESIEGAANKRALDTNGDGVLDGQDDAYAPYYPGDEVVDASGLSIYWKGPNFQNLNEGQPGGYCANVLDGIDSDNGRQTTPFYSTYCQGKSKPCVITEAGAAYHVNVAGGVASQHRVQKAFWEDCITNATFLDAYPEIKMINVFEQEKYEEDPNGLDLRDFRLSNVSAIAIDFASAVNAMGTRFAFATPTTQPGGGIVSGTAIPTTNPDLLGVETRTDVVAALSSATVTWTFTSYTTPPPVIIQTTVPDQLQSAAPVSSQANLAAVDESSSATSIAPFICVAMGSIACVLLGGMLI